MEDLQSVALSVLKSNYEMGFKISKLEEFKIDTEDMLDFCESERTKKDLEDYISWLDRQINSLKRNCTEIVK